MANGSFLGQRVKITVVRMLKRTDGLRPVVFKVESMETQ